MSGEVIKVGFCVAYDWQLLEYSLPPVYNDAEVICLSIDKNRRTWAGKPFEFDEVGFRKLISRIDIEDKIRVYEDDFSKPQLNSRENCNQQRTLMAEQLGKGGWHIQIDIDEYFFDFHQFAKHLISINPNPSGNEKPLNVCVNLIPIYKKTDNGYLVVDFGDNLPEMAPFATNVPQYDRARNNGHFNRTTRFYAIHETWARSEEQLRFKLNNWGHSSEELNSQKTRDRYIEGWLELNETNFSEAKDVHPATPKTWPALRFYESKNTAELIESMQSPEFPLSSWRLFLRNNRNVARLNQLFKR